MATEWYAHSEGADGRRQLLRDHLARVGEQAARFADRFGAGEEARAAGIMHDLGKYSPLFKQRLLTGKKPPGVRAIDHSSPGARLALERWQLAGALSAFVVSGHHGGLRSFDFIKRHIAGESGVVPEDEALVPSETDMTEIQRRLEADNIQLPALDASLLEGKHTAAQMLSVRMIFSCVVDADFLDTEAHFSGARAPGPELDPERALRRIDEYIADVRAESDAHAVVNEVRDEVHAACRHGAGLERGLFTLTAPTGAGKTLAMLLFAMRHALQHNLERVIVVLPYLSIIDQTANLLHKMFDEAMGKEYVLEHHSRAFDRGSGDGEQAGRRRKPIEDDESWIEPRKQLAENWDAPLIVTTSVQALESLFANRPGPCRKLHRMANAVIMFDEVQTLPGHLLQPTLATLSQLASRFKSTVLFSTATQPAFSHLNSELRAMREPGWEPHELIPNPESLFARMKRVNVRWRGREDGARSWEELAGEILDRDSDRVLCVVNMRRHAHELFRAVNERAHSDQRVLHLSTTLCGGHRDKLLADVTRRLKKELPCILISTQCVEAGVDLDFPVVYRAHGPLEAIAQAAGRCNRGGKLDHGEVVVFRPEANGGRLYPGDAYKKAAAIADEMLAKREGAELDLDDPAVFREYYHDLYSLTGYAKVKEELKCAIKGVDFPAVAAKYRLIDKPTVQVLVAWNEHEYEALAERAREQGLTREWIRAAKRHSVSVFRGSAEQSDRLEPIPVFPLGKDASSAAPVRLAADWFISHYPDDYDEELGWIPETGGDEFM